MRQLVATILVYAFVIVSCNESKVDEKKIPVFLQGYWIPKEIKWGGDERNSNDTGDVFRTAHFRTLCFDTLGNKFLYLASTQRHPNHYGDSIIFAGEPVINVFSGTWRYVSDTALEVNYKQIERKIDSYDTSEKKEQIKFFLQKDTLLLFDNKFYTKTQKYDKISQQAIEEYRKNYLK